MGWLMETIIASVITGIVAIIVGLINSHYQANATRTLIEYKIDQLEKKQDKHNKVIERVYELEKHEEVMEEQIKVINHRLRDLEE